MDHQAVQAKSAEPAQWCSLWTLAAALVWAAMQRNLSALLTPTASKIQAVDCMKTLIAG
jgi:hypothetical protein